MSPGQARPTGQPAGPAGGQSGSAQRVVVFVDYQNLHGWARRRFLPPGSAPATGHIDPLQLAQRLVARRRWPSHLTEVRIYRGRPAPDRQPGASAANDRQTATWQRSSRVTVIRRPLRYPRDWPATPASEKGIDVAIAVDMIRLATTGAYDVAILVSSDTDLLPAVETLIDLRLAHVEVAAWTGAHPLRFVRNGRRLPWCHFLNEPEYHVVEDPTDYTRPAT